MGNARKSGEDAKVKGARKGVSYGVFFFGLVLSQFRGPN